MNTLIFLLLIFCTSFVFLLPQTAKYYFSLLIHILIVSITTIWCVKAFAGPQPLVIEYSSQYIQTPKLVIDSLTAFFMLIINFTSLTGILYAKGYLQPYLAKKKSIIFSLHYFSFMWLHISMLLVTMMQDALSFLIVWEIMSLSSFLLVAFDSENGAILKTAINYLIQMHIGLVFILIAFLIAKNTNGETGFFTLKDYFSTHSNFWLFFLFFLGFGIKAGFIPLHSWLPQAHPAAPSHVSGVMSGVMIKLGIYGILRVLTSIHSDWLAIGVFIFIISIITAIIGIMMALVQRDLKKLLAYSSIENIGIIGLGIGLGVIGIAMENNMLATLGFAGGLLHILNHSLFKSLLFYASGSVYKATHTRNIEHLGAVIKKMPKTSMLFLLGALAICGLPPFNGFISEFIIYVGLFKGLYHSTLYQSLAYLSGIIALALVGGLVLFTFTKVFGLAFLGVARTNKVEKAVEVSNSMLFPQVLIGILIVVIGLMPVIFIKPILSIVTTTFSIPFQINTAEVLLTDLYKISLIGGIFVVLTILLLIFRHLRSKSKVISYGPTWGCGYTAGTAKHQYTAASFTYHYTKLANSLLHTKKVMKPIEDNEIFPAKRTFVTHTQDIIKEKFIDLPVEKIKEAMKHIAFLQTGQIQHYILYAFIFIFFIFMLSFFKLI